MLARPMSRAPGDRRGALTSALLTAAFFGGWFGEPYNAAGCAHHDATNTFAHELDVPTAESDAPSRGHAAHRPGSDESAPSEHGPCSCIGACAGGGVVAAGSPVWVGASVAPPAVDVPSAPLVTLPRGPRPHAQPYPNAPPLLGMDTV